MRLAIISVAVLLSLITITGAVRLNPADNELNTFDGDRQGFERQSVAKRSSSFERQSMAKRSSASFKASVLREHNAARAKHGAKPLVWSSSLAKSARKWSLGCRFAHGGNPKNTGQNLAAGYSDFGAVMDAFMSERKDYNPSHPAASHFTQVVWKGTTHVGCAVHRCSSMKGVSGSPHYVSPAGNVFWPTLAQTVAYWKKNVQK